MSGFAVRMTADPLARGWDWGTINAANGTVVDVGGGCGEVSIGLAKYFPNIKFIVQDFADVIAEGPEYVPEDMKGRIEFMESNFLQRQHLQGKDVYFMRSILHNWPDEYCVRILKDLVTGELYSWDSKYMTLEESY
jgi:ubiquinone/menaquinone biosynthesis C-methylase UbiE